MSEILSLFIALSPHLSATTLRQFRQVVFALLAMTGRVTMLNISRWTSQGSSYRTIQRFYNTVIPWGSLYWAFFRSYLFDPESVYIVAGDETVVSKSGDATYGLSRFFASVYGRTIPGLAFFAVSLVSVKQRCSYPMGIEQIVRCKSSEDSQIPASHPDEAPQTRGSKRKGGRPKGSRNRDKTDVVLTEALKRIQKMVNRLLEQVNGWIQLRYLVLDGYFGHNKALQMAAACGLSLISKLRVNAALYFRPTTPYTGRRRPRIYGDRFNPRKIDAKWRIRVETIGNITTEVYQMQLRHKHFAAPLNVVCILKTHLIRQQKSYVLLFSDDLALEAEQLIDYYCLRFQLEFNFRDAKQYWGLEDFMNINKIPVNTAANLSMFMVNVSAKLTSALRLECHEYSVLDLKAHYRGLKYLQETLKILPQKTDPIVIESNR